MRALCGFIETLPTSAVEFMPSQGQIGCGRISPPEQPVRSRLGRTWSRWALACAMVLGLLCGSVQAAPFTGPTAIRPPSAGQVRLIQYRVVTDEISGVKLRLPLGIRKEEEKEGTGGKWQNYKIDNLIVSVLRFDPAVRPLDGLFKHYKGIPGRRISNSWLRSDRFALEGTDGEYTEFSIDMVESGGQLRGLSLVISRRSSSAGALSRMREMAAAIRASFEPFPAAAAPATSPPLIREITTSTPPVVTRPAASTPRPVAVAEPVPPPPPPAPAWSVSRRSDDGAFDQFTGATLTGVVLLESPPGRSYSQEECASACKTVEQCVAFTRFGDGRCVMRSSRGEVQQAPAPGTSSGVRRSGRD